MGESRGPRPADRNVDELLDEMKLSSRRSRRAILSRSQTSKSDARKPTPQSKTIKSSHPNASTVLRAQSDQIRSPRSDPESSLTLQFEPTSVYTANACRSSIAPVSRPSSRALAQVDCSAPQSPLSERAWLQALKDGLCLDVWWPEHWLFWPVTA